MPMARWRTAWMAARYGVVGACCAALNLLIMFVGIRLLALHYVAASLLTCLITIPLSYLLHRRVTFRVDAEASLPEFTRFVTAQLSQFALGLALLAALVELAGLAPLTATVVMTMLMFAYGFLAQATWVFEALGARRPEPPAATRLRVLQVSAFYPAHGGGIEVVAGRLANGLAEAGCQVHWMAGGTGDEAPAAASPRLEIEPARSIDPLERRLGLPCPLWTPRSVWRLWLGVRRCDIVHLHDFLYMPTLLAMLMAALHRRPVVLTQHVGEIPFASPLARGLLRTLNATLGRLAMRAAAQVVFVGEPVRQHFNGLARFRRPPQLVPNGVDHETYHPAPSTDAGPRPLQFLFVGRFVEKKGLRLLQHCVDLPGVHWTFLGRGPLSPRSWGESPTLTVHEDRRAAEVVPFYQQADLLVLPSTGEGFPLVVQEALACGTPVLVSREVAEAFPQTDAACVFDVELRTADPVHALREALEALAAQPDRLREARVAALRLSGQWSWPACVQSYLSIYAAVLPSRPLPTPHR